MLAIGALRACAEELLPDLAGPHDQRAKTFVATISATYIETTEPNQQTWATETRQMFTPTERDNNFLGDTGTAAPPMSEQMPEICTGSSPLLGARFSRSLL